MLPFQSELRVFSRAWLPWALACLLTCAALVLTANQFEEVRRWVASPQPPGPRNPVPSAAIGSFWLAGIIAGAIALRRLRHGGVPGILALKRFGVGWIMFLVFYPLERAANYLGRYAGDPQAPGFSWADAALAGLFVGTANWLTVAGIVPAVVALLQLRAARRRA